MTKNILDFLLHDVTATMIIKYNRISQFIKFRIFTEQEKLLAIAAQVKTAQTLKDITLAFKKALNRFAIQKWPINCLDVIRFSRS